MMSTSKPKINLISLTDRPNGAENVLLKMAISVNGNLIFIAKNQDTRLVIPENLSKKYLSHKSKVVGMIKLLPLLAKMHKDQIVMSTHPYLNAYLGFCKRIGLFKNQLIVRECTSIFTRFSGFKKFVYQILYKLGYPAADLVVCQTDTMLNQLLDHNPFLDSSRVIVQPNPIDVDKIMDLGNEHLNQIHEGEQFICTAGRLIPEKGFDILIQAFGILRKSNPKIKLIILGEGKEREKLTNLISDLELQQSVVLNGHIANPVPYFKHAKVCVVSSITEGFPNVLLEMMASNPAVVSTMCAGGIDSIPNITTVEVNNVLALATAIQNTLDNTQTKDNPHIDYLLKRSPQNFSQSILRALAQ